jgi:hypothetical protein
VTTTSLSRLLQAPRRSIHFLINQNRITKDYKSEKRKSGRPRPNQEFVEPVLHMARENARWGYKRLEGPLRNLGDAICSSTVANILKHHGIEPAPQRQRQLSWKTFIKSHMDAFEDVNLLAVFGKCAGLSLWRETLRERIRDVLSDSDTTIEEMPPFSIAAMDRFPEVDHVEENPVSCAMTSIKSVRWTRGPPSLFNAFKSTLSNPLAKAA